MELKEFQGLALRTESSIDQIKLNRENLAHLLRVVVGVTEILDGVKKAVFYNKTTKLDEKTHDLLQQIGRSTAAVAWNLKGFNEPSECIQQEDLAFDNIDPRVFHGLIGIITESGELAAALLKAVEDATVELDAVNLQEEMSDIAWYKAILHDSLGLDWGQGLTNVINKLRIRYPDKYSDYAAENRNLEAERAALEVGVFMEAELMNKGGPVYKLHPDVEKAIAEIPKSATQADIDYFKARIAKAESENRDTTKLNAQLSLLEETLVRRAWPLKELYGIEVGNTCACGKNPACECKEN